MSIKTVQTVDPKHPLWLKFVVKLRASLGRPSDHVCDHTHKRTRTALEELGLDEASIISSISYLESRGGYCDCETLINAVDWNPILEKDTRRQFLPRLESHIKNNIPTCEAFKIVLKEMNFSERHASEAIHLFKDFCCEFCKGHACHA